MSIQLRRDRRRIALLWLSRLQRDVHIVWEFRRFLALNHFSVTVGEEIGIGCTACFALLYLEAARIIVFVCGPFALRKAIRNTKVPLELLSNCGAHLLARAPAALRTQLEQEWTQQVLAWDKA